MKIAVDVADLNKIAETLEQCEQLLYGIDRVTAAMKDSSIVSYSSLSTRVGKTHKMVGQMIKHGKEVT